MWEVSRVRVRGALLCVVNEVFADVRGLNGVPVVVVVVVAVVVVVVVLVW